MMKGALHVHSTYSDGERSLPELRRLFQEDGCRFVAITDHADAFDAGRVREYVAECEALSDSDFAFLPGLEFGCERRMHILGYGVTTLTTSTDPREVLRHIQRENGVDVIAHPQDAAFPWIESFDVLPRGIEVWNTKYDGKHAPRGRTFALLHRMQARRSDMRAFYGQDYHWREQFRHLYTIVDSDNIDRESILGALRDGRFHAEKAELVLPSDGLVDPLLLADFEATNARASRFRSVVKKANALRKRLGIAMPPALKSQLRRFF
jgi:hypothetical protein